MRSIGASLAVAVCLLAAPSARAQQSFPATPELPIQQIQTPPRPWRLTAATGFEYDSGIAGRTDELFVPVSVRFEYRGFSVGVATSLVSIDGERIVGGYSIGRPSDTRAETAVDVFNTAEGTSLGLDDIDLSLDETGIGDTLISLSYAWYQPDGWLPFIELTSSVKIPTASKQDQIGTGEYDWILQLDVARPLGRFTPFATLAYRFNGGPIVLRERLAPIASQAVVVATGQSTVLLEEARIPLDDTVELTVGSSVRVSDRLLSLRGSDVAVHAGLMYDFQQSPFDGVEHNHELISYLTFELSRQLQFGPYFVVGLSESAPDWGIATQLVFTY
jgi:hypothetical protein